LTAMLGPNVAEARNATVLGLNDVDKQKLEEARQLAMSMTSHPLVFGTIDHTEKAGELLAELVHALDQKHAQYEDLKACAANNARNLAREAHAWWTAARDAAANERARCALRVALHSQYPIETDFDRGYDKARKDAAETLRTMVHEAEPATIPVARLIELETAEHERDILRADTWKLKERLEAQTLEDAVQRQALAREAHTWSKAAEHYAKPRQPLDPLEIEELWDKANEEWGASLTDAAEPFRGEDAFHHFARLLERAHGIGAEHG
jgi:hypothetical protein